MPLITFIIILGCFITSHAQVNFNQHNPYVNNSEIHHLRKMDIDLFAKPYTDSEFQKNVRLSLDLAKQYNDDTAMYTALSISSIFGLLVGAVGLIVDKNNNKTAVNRLDQFTVQSSLKTEYLLFGTAGAVTAGFALKARTKRNESKSRFEQQLKITKDQYSLLR